jgi:inositol-hexakisphosphate/diphosphoinositol-pentakisphosphate 1-kinase
LKFKDAKNLTIFLNLIVEKIAELDHTDPMMKEYMQIKFVLESGGHFEGLTRKLQMKVHEREVNAENDKAVIKKVMIILKWGGDLTYLGYEDAIALGKKMREERYDDNDCLSLYSSYRHDLKTYASDEGRCIKTAAAFLKGFLSIEGELAPIISSMVQADAKAQSSLFNI